MAPRLKPLSRLRKTVPDGDRSRRRDDERLARKVAAGETNHLPGELTVDGEALPHHREWWRKAPATKWLMLGNHDVDPVNRIRPFGIDHTAVTLYAAGNPPLVLTHVPLLQVPHGAVNVHGHLHEQESPTPNRHVNVSVEQLNYRPGKLSDIRRLRVPTRFVRKYTVTSRGRSPLVPMKL